MPRSSREHGKVFTCRRGCNTRTATYTEEFEWESIYGGSDDIPALIERVRSQTKATRKRKIQDQPREDTIIDVGNEGNRAKTYADHPSGITEVMLKSLQRLAKDERYNTFQRPAPDPNGSTTRNGLPQHTDGKNRISCLPRLLGLLQ